MHKRFLSVRVLISGAVSIYVGWQFFKLILKFPEEREKLAFAGICLAVFL